jgi:protein-disulfide isomerase-like protein with CxxC motif
MIKTACSHDSMFCSNAKPHEFCAKKTGNMLELLDKVKHEHLIDGTRLLTTATLVLVTKSTGLQQQQIEDLDTAIEFAKAMRAEILKTL